MALLWIFLLAIRVTAEFNIDSCEEAALVQLSTATAALSHNESAPSERDAQLAGNHSPDALKILAADSTHSSHSKAHHPFRRSSLGGSIKTLYHQTSTTAGPLILKGSFRRGHSGWCGGGIYFADSKESTYAKATGVDSHLGFIIEAIVDLGFTKYLPYYCTSSPACWGGFHYDCVDHSFQGDRFQSEGYDSISFNPGDGQEYMIWNSSRVLSMKRVY